MTNGGWLIFGQIDQPPAEAFARSPTYRIVARLGLAIRGG